VTILYVEAALNSVEGEAFLVQITEIESQTATQCTEVQQTGYPSYSRIQLDQLTLAYHQIHLGLQAALVKLGRIPWPVTGETELGARLFKLLTITPLGEQFTQLCGTHLTLQFCAIAAVTADPATRRLHGHITILQRYLVDTQTIRTARSQQLQTSQICVVDT